MVSLVFIPFVFLIFLTWRRSALSPRCSKDWILDGSGLLMQGLVIPFFQTAGLYVLLEQIFPSWKSALDIPSSVAFLLNFVVVDYLYYWNHRFLHSRMLWDWHAVHHTAQRMDVLVTSRNSVWTHFFIVYVWINALCAFILKDPSWFLISASLTAVLDLWKHSEIVPRTDNTLYRFLAWILLTPKDHAWHHGRNAFHGNFGANLKMWDQLHGTYVCAKIPPHSLGISLKDCSLRQLFYPLGINNDSP
jgi:sterol desaturase/sphingolipid hydroxylase (fatty acid hydroxylase superfamily)